MEENQSVDFPLLIFAILLSGFGLVMVYSSSMYMAMEEAGSASFYFKKQAINIILGLVVMMFLTKVNYKGYLKISTALFVFGCTLLAVLLVQKLINGHGVHRWFYIGGRAFQPSELMKVILIIYLSSTIVKMGDKVRNLLKGFLPLLGIIAIACGLVVLEPNLGTSILIFLIGITVLFIGRAKFSHLFMIAAMGTTAALFVVLKMPYMQKRIEIFLDPSKGYQINQSIISIGSGGFFGVGLGQSTQKFLFLPENHTDFVFSILAEELGFIGVTAIFILAFCFVYRGFKIAREAPDMFGFLVASGLSSMIAYQLVINIAVALGAMPTTGMTLPFISYGGSSLLLSFVATGILLNISKQGRFELRLSREFGSRIHSRRSMIK